MLVARLWIAAAEVGEDDSVGAHPGRHTQRLFCRAVPFLARLHNIVPFAFEVLAACNLAYQMILISVCYQKATKQWAGTLDRPLEMHQVGNYHTSCRPTLVGGQVLVALLRNNKPTVNIAEMPPGPAVCTPGQAIQMQKTA